MQRLAGGVLHLAGKVSLGEALLLTLALPDVLCLNKLDFLPHQRMDDATCIYIQLLSTLALITELDSDTRNCCFCFYHIVK